jgi:alpha-amylase
MPRRPLIGFTPRVLAMVMALILFGAVLSDAAPPRPTPRRSVPAGQEIMLQGFGWNSQRSGSPGRWYELIGQRAKDIADLGATMIWFPPVSRSVSPQGYLPGDYYDLGTPDRPTFYGHRDQLVKALRALNEAGVAPIADIVVNHRCAGKQDANGIWNIFHFPSGKASWEQWAVCRGQYGGAGADDSGEGYHAAPDIDHTNPTVQKDIVEWLNWLKTLGFKGWRYDYSKGYAAKYAGLYDSKTRPVFSVGEIWTNMAFSGSTLNPNQDAHRQELCNWLDKAGSTAAAFDFTTKGMLQVAVNGEYWRLRDKEGKAAGLIGWWPERAVTFIDNHDTGSQQSHWPFPGEKVMQGYAYILTHPGVPCIFWEHVYDWNLRGPIQKLVEVRRRFGLHKASKLQIIKAEQGLYAAVIDGKVAIKMGWVDWAPDASFELLTHGSQFAVWGKKAASPTR